MKYRKLSALLPSSPVMANKKGKVDVLGANDNNSLLGELDIRNTEFYVKQKNHKIWRGFLKGLRSRLPSRYKPTHPKLVLRL